MTVNEVMEKMIVASQGSFHDINHFLKVWAYARNIGMGEKLDEDTQKTLEFMISHVRHLEKSMEMQTVKSRRKYHLL